MVKLPFSLELLEWLIQFRNPFLNTLFYLITWYGDVEGYLLLFAVIYVSYDKKLAVQIGMLTLLTGIVNIILKTIIANPRPWVEEGMTYEKWEIPEEEIAILSESYSTPSNHAMSASSTYGYLMYRHRSKINLLIGSFLIVLISISRVYLGVHYLEDVILGIILGLVFLFIYVRYEPQISRLVNKTFNSPGLSLSILIIILIINFVLGGLTGFSQTQQLIGLLVGLLFGAISGVFLERRYVQLDLENLANSVKIFRIIFVLMVLLPILLGGRWVEGRIEEMEFLLTIFNTLFYLLMGLLITFILPLILDFIKNSRREH